MDFDALYHANFKLFSDAVADWSRLADNLDRLKRDAEDGLHQAANKADWAGINSQVTKEFIGKTAGEFTDAHTQARSIHRILSDTLGELRSYRQQLVDAVEGGRAKSLAVFPTGHAFTVTSNVPMQAQTGESPDNAADITALRDKIQGILDRATESDTSARTALIALADQSRTGFSGADYKDRDSAAAAIEKADEMARLAKKDPQELTVREFDRLTAGLKDYSNDPLFAERFATTLGPTKMLEFWTGVTDPRNYDISSNRMDKLDDLQRGLSLTLANASQSDSTAMAGWRRDVIDLGTTRIGGGGTGPMGFQVMSNLMRVGDYDDRFMVDYGTKLMAAERQITGYGQNPNRVWQFGGGGGPSQYLNRIGEDSGADPLAGYLRGLSNSPDAATDFFNQEYVAKDNPDNPFERDTDGNGKNGKVPLSNFQYLFEERDWPRETSLDGEDLHTGRNNLAMALEAATTGHPAGEMPTPDTPAHNDAQTKLFESIVASIADDAARLTDHGYMSDSVGQITSEYLPEINRAMTDDEDEDTNKLFPVVGSSASLNHRDVTALLVSVGQNPEGYAAVEVGNKAYMANVMDYHMRPDLAADHRYSKDTQFAVAQIAHGSGEVSGTLAIGRQEAVAGPADEDDKLFDQSVAQWKNVASGVVGTGIGIGATFVASPVVGAVAGGVAATVGSTVLESLFQDAEAHAKEKAGVSMGEMWENGLDENASYSEKAAELAAKAHNRTDLEAASIDEKARTAAQAGFRAAGTNTQFMAPNLKTDI
ncbi:hypothetical protein ABZZ80_01415 [Streptomyces sp. NPDC006356]